MLKKYSKILIVGSGPAGYTASIYIARSNLNVNLITGLEKGGQLTKTNKVENWPGKFNGIDGFELMENMYKHSKKFNVKIFSDNIIKVNFKKNPFILMGENNIYICDFLILATGASPRYLNIPSEKKFIGKGISTCATCDGFFFKKKNIIIVGGGNVAIEDALYLSKIVNKIILVHRKDKFTAESILIDRIKNIKNIFFEFNSIIDEFIGENNNLKSVILKNLNNNSIKKINTDGVFLAIGYQPNTKIFKNQLDLDVNGYIITKKKDYYSTLTSVPGIFAAGDVQDPIYRQAITSSGSGCMAAMDLQNYINKFSKLK